MFRALIFAVSLGLCMVGDAAIAFNPQPDPPGKILQGRVLPGETKVLKEVDPGPAKGQLLPGETKMFKEVDPAPAHSNLVNPGLGGNGKPHIDKKTKPQPTPPCDPLKKGTVLEQFSWEAQGDLNAQKGDGKMTGGDLTGGKTANLTTLGQPQLTNVGSGLNIQVNLVPGIIPAGQTNTTPQITPPSVVTGGPVGRIGR
jgi:hypothetical protein